MNHRTNSLWSVGVLVVLLVAGAAGCSVDHKTFDRKSATVPAQSSEGITTAPEPDSNNTAARVVVSSPSSATAGGPDDTRPGDTRPRDPEDTGAGDTRPDDKIVRTAALDLTVTDLDATVRKARTIMIAKGATVSREDVRSDAGSPQFGQATLQYRIAPNGFFAALDELGVLGTVNQRTVTAEDVAAQYFDLDGRLKTARASADRLRALLATAADTRMILELERSLTTRETEIESMAGSLRGLSDQIMRSTITVELRATRPLADAPTGSPSKNIPGFSRGLRTGWAAMVNTTRVIVTVLGALLPFIPFFAVALAVAVWRRRRSRRPVAQGTTSMLGGPVSQGPVPDEPALSGPGVGRFGIDAEAGDRLGDQVS